MAAKTTDAVPTFAHYEGESDEQRDAHLAGLESELGTRAALDDLDITNQIEAEIARIRGGLEKTNRLRAEA